MWAVLPGGGAAARRTRNTFFFFLFLRSQTVSQSAKEAWVQAVSEGTHGHLGAPRGVGSAQILWLRPLPMSLVTDRVTDTPGAGGAGGALQLGAVQRAHACARAQAIGDRRRVTGVVLVQGTLRSQRPQIPHTTHARARTCVRPLWCPVPVAAVSHCRPGACRAVGGGGGGSVGGL
jgi:hypothetical protein